MTHADGLPLLPTSSPADPASPEIDLVHRLMRIANGWWRVTGLSSGRSGNVSGEVRYRLSPFRLTLRGGAHWLTAQISSHILSTAAADDKQGVVPDVPRCKPVQYRLESNTVKLFAKGTGRGYL